MRKSILIVGFLFLVFISKFDKSQTPAQQQTNLICTVMMFIGAMICWEIESKKEEK